MLLVGVRAVVAGGMDEWDQKGRKSECVRWKYGMRGGESGRMSRGEGDVGYKAVEVPERSKAQVGLGDRCG